VRVTLDIPDQLVRHALNMAGGSRSQKRVAELLLLALHELCPPTWYQLGHVVELAYYTDELYAEPVLVRHTFQEDAPAHDPEDRPALVWDGSRLRFEGGEYYVAPGMGVVDL